MENLPSTENASRAFFNNSQRTTTSRISSRWEEQTSPSIPNPSCSSPAHAPTIEFAPTTNQSQLTTNIGAYRTQSRLCHATYYSYATARESNLFPSLWRLRQPQLRQSLNSKLSISHSQLPTPQSSIAVNAQPPTTAPAVSRRGPMFSTSNPFPLSLTPFAALPLLPMRSSEFGVLPKTLANQRDFLLSFCSGKAALLLPNFPFALFPNFVESAECLFSFEIRQKHQLFSFFSCNGKAEFTLFADFVVAKEFFFTFLTFF